MTDSLESGDASGMYLGELLSRVAHHPHTANHASVGKVQEGEQNPAVQAGDNGPALSDIYPRCSFRVRSSLASLPKPWKYTRSVSECQGGFRRSDSTLLREPPQLREALEVYLPESPLSRNRRNPSQPLDLLPVARVPRASRFMRAAT